MPKATPQRQRRRKRKRVAFSLILLFLLLLSFCALAKGQAMPKKGQIIYSGIAVATAYNSEEGQTDSTPWVTASGTRCREGVIASNFLPFGTKVKIEGFNRTFVVEDRMHKRFSDRIDIWFRHHQDAKQFGKRKIRYDVIA
jgi:3D (Asp-Asp-Asp) domain-containing protein